MCLLINFCSSFSSLFCVSPNKNAAITTFLFSHIGLCALVFGYSVFGAFTFQALEAQNELKKKETMFKVKKISIFTFKT